MQFTYEAINSSGAREKGSAEAANALVLGHQLKDQGLVPVKISETNKKKVDFFSGIGNRIRLRDKLTFIEDLGVMLKSGISLPRSLQVLSRQAGNKQFSKVVGDISRSVENGQSLHESLAKHQEVFSDIFVSMVRVGEMSGTLDQSLEYLKIQLEREAELSSRVKGAMIYPSVVVSVMVLAAIVMATFVLPKLTSIFSDFGAQLPVATRIIITISDFLSHNTILVFGALIILVAGAIRVVKLPVVKNVIFTAAVYLPGIGTLAREVSLARFSRIASSLLKSGISVVETLAVTGEAMPNPVYKKACLEASAAVKTGKPMTESLAKYERLFPFLVTQMLSVGEEAGSIETILEQLAKHFEASVDAQLKNISSIIEPVLLVVIGATVGVVAYALIIPIYNIGSQIG